MVKKVLQKTNILKRAEENTKLGKGKYIITKGKWKGFPLYSLTLTERKTCPTDCSRLSSCYGNAMPFAHRWKEGPELEKKLIVEVGRLAIKYPHGFAIRLHVLGDFYSPQYVKMWGELLYRYPNLHVYGYTARWSDAIWHEINKLRNKFTDRWWVRISKNKNRPFGKEIYASAPNDYAIPCPEQTGKTESCLTCGICWSTDLTVSFEDHDKINKDKPKVMEAT